MHDAYICDGIRTPFGRYGGALSAVRTDDLASLPIRELMSSNPQVDWAAVEDVAFGCAPPAPLNSSTIRRATAFTFWRSTRACRSSIR